jgi:hypothetical protein
MLNHKGIIFYGVSGASPLVVVLQPLQPIVKAPSSLSVPPATSLASLLPLALVENGALAPLHKGPNGTKGSLL